MGAGYTSIVLGDHPVPVELQSYLSFIESVREGVTKRKLADDFLRDLDFTVSQTEDQSSRVLFALQY